ncbi:MAG: hypothetical protein KBD04_01600 [Proteobacteria bacterium]|nr:hypothetical protein [Pseudomonadota bacterium]
MKKIIKIMPLLILVCLVLSGCNPFGAFRPTSDEIQSSSWAPNPDDPYKKKRQKQQLYCYRTLGDPVCYDHELGESERYRLIGKTADPVEKDPTVPAILSWIPFPLR